MLDVADPGELTASWTALVFATRTAVVSNLVSIYYVMGTVSCFLAWAGLSLKSPLSLT